MRAIRRYVITITTLGAASVLVIVFGILGAADRIGYDLPELEPVEASSVERIVIERPSESVSLFRSAEGWRVAPGDYAAHNPSVRFLLDAMVNLRITDVVSLRDDPVRYDLDPAQRVRVTLQSNQRDLRVLDIGRRAATYGHTYVSVPGDSRIFQAAGELRGAFDRGVDALREKGVLTFNPAEVTDIGITMRTNSGTEVIELTRRDGSWNLTDGSGSTAGGGTPELDDEAINGALAFLGSFSAYQFRYDSPVSGDPWLEVRISAGSEHTLSVYSKEGTIYPARTSQSEYDFNMLSFQPGLILEPFSLQIPEE